MSDPYKILYTKQGLKDKQIAFEAGYGEKSTVLEFTINFFF